METTVTFRNLYSSEHGKACKYIREKVFVEEQGFIEEFDEIDEAAFFAVIYVDGEPAATGRCFPDKNVSDTYIIGRVAVMSKFRKRGLGERVMQMLEEAALKNGADKFVLSSQLQARPFYEKCGYTATGDIYLDQHCPHIKMVKTMRF